MINTLNQRQIVVGLALVVAVYFWLGYSFVFLQQPLLARWVYIVLLCFGGGFLLSRTIKNKHQHFELEPHSNPIALTIWLSVIATIILWGITLLVKPGIFDPELITDGLAKCGSPVKNYWWIAGTFAILNPIAEEFLWRKNMFPWLRSMMTHNRALLVSAVLFAGYHPLAIILLFPPAWLAGIFLMVFIGGLFLAHLYIKTRHIRYPIALHMVININLILIYSIYTPS